MKRILFLLIFSSCLHIAQGQRLGDKLYLFPDQLVKIDTSFWKTDSYAVFLNGLNGFADLKSKTDKEMTLSIRHFSIVTDTTDYKKCACYPEANETYPRYQKVLRQRKLILEKDTFHISVHESKTITYYIAWCKRQTFSCFLKVSAVGLVKDSSRILENFIALRQGFQKVSPAEMDKAFGLPLSDIAYQDRSTKQLAIYDELCRDSFERDIQHALPTDRENLIKSIKNLHEVNYDPVGWTNLPDLSKLPLDSLVRIKSRYYHVSSFGGNEGIPLAPLFFPPSFTYQQYETSVRRLVRGEITLTDLARYYSRERFKPGEAFYFSRIADNMAYLSLHTDKIIKPFFSKDFYSATFSSGNDGVLQFNVRYKISKEDYPEGSLILKKEGNGYKTQIIPPLWISNSNGHVQDLKKPGNYFVRELVDWGNDYANEKRRVYLLNSRSDSTVWISFSIPLIRESNKTIAFQFSGEYEDSPVINLPKWKKLYPHDSPDAYYQAIQVRDNDTSPFDRAKLDRDKLLDNSPPADRSYNYSYLLADVNKDGKQDIVSFIISNGKLMFYKCFTQAAKGLKELSGENIKSQLMALPKYKELLKRSLLNVDKEE